MSEQQTDAFPLAEEQTKTLPIKAALSCTRFRRHRVRCFMEQEVCHGETAVYARVQA